MSTNLNNLRGVRKYTPDDLRRYYRLAHNGNINAQITLAFGYLFGSFGKQDSVESMRWCSMALQKGAAAAKYLYGMYHFMGLGVPKDFNIAFRWWSEAANDGDRDGQTKTAWAYDQGVGVARDESQAFNWWLKAAAQGVMQAQLAVAHHYETGKAVDKKDDLIACSWYLLAEMNGSNDANMKLKKIRQESKAMMANAESQVQAWLRQNPRLDNKYWIEQYEHSMK